MVRIASVVEGHGEVEALPVLIRRICEEQGEYGHEVGKPHRIHRPEMHTPKVLAAVRIQRARVGKNGIVVVLYDADDDEWEAAKKSTQEQLGQERAVIAVAVREYEAWFLAALESLGESRAIKRGARFDADPEQPRNAKKQLELHMTESYRETLHQPKFSALMDLDLLRRRSPSYGRFEDDLAAALKLNQ